MENGKTGAHIPSAFARRALRHEFETPSPTVAPSSKDSSERAVTTNSSKPNAREIRRSSVLRKKRPTVRRSFDHKHSSKPSALPSDNPVSGTCDNNQVGIRTRRMSAADASNNQKSADIVETENVSVDSCSRLSSASTAPAAAASLPAEVKGLFSILIYTFI